MMRESKETTVSPDMKVGQYNILKDTEIIDNNIEKTFSLASYSGKGKILIKGSNHGSKAICTNDMGEPADGVAGCLRNYLQVQSFSVSYKNGSGILYTDMPPQSLLNFIEDLGMFSGFHEIKIQESTINEDWKDDFFIKDSVFNTPKYKALEKEYNNILSKREEYWKSYKEAEDYLNKNGKIKPKSEYNVRDEIEAMVGNKPRKYKDTKKADMYKSQLEYSIQSHAKLSSKLDELRQEMENMKLYAHNEESSRYNFTKPKKTDKKDFKGFKTETGIPYYDDRYKSGKAYIAEMPPKEYLLRCAFQIFPEGTIESTILSCNDKKVKKFANKMKSGEKFNMPYLDLSRREQEGRHRAVAALIAGIPTIPVLIM